MNALVTIFQPTINLVRSTVMCMSRCLLKPVNLNSGRFFLYTKSVSSTKRAPGQLRNIPTEWH
jgi:hypothetical protein